jgi:D-alanyl-D-alanine carboxypeptidase
MHQNIYLVCKQMATKVTNCPTKIANFFTYAIAYFFLFLLLYVSQAQAQGYKHSIDSVLRANGVVGFAYSAFSGEKALVETVWGNKITNESNPIQITDRFHLGSNTKAFTSFLIAKAVEEGKLTWKTKFFEVFPDLKANSHATYSDITLADLLSHRAGIEPFTTEKEIAKIPNLVGSVREQRLLFAEYALKQEPTKLTQGSLYTYSSAGYILATAMLEKKTDKAWEELAVELFNLEMTLSIDFGFPNRLNRKQPWGHRTTEAAKLQATSPDDYLKPLPIFAPAEDLNINIQQYTRWLRHHLLGIQGKDKLISAENYQFIHFGLPDYALGWRNMTKGENHVSTHEGSLGTFYARAVLLKDRNLGFAFFANSAEPKTIMAMNEIQKILLKQFGK